MILTKRSDLRNYQSSQCDMMDTVWIQHLVAERSWSCQTFDPADVVRTCLFGWTIELTLMIAFHGLWRSRICPVIRSSRCHSSRSIFPDPKSSNLSFSTSMKNCVHISIEAGCMRIDRVSDSFRSYSLQVKSQWSIESVDDHHTFIRDLTRQWVLEGLTHQSHEM
jgi:hypothetical protein